VAMAEFNGADDLNPHVRYLVDFLRRRDEGKNGRFQEGLRGKDIPDPVAVAIAHVMPTFSKPAAAAVPAGANGTPIAEPAGAGAAAAPAVAAPAAPDGPPDGLPGAPAPQPN